MRISSTLPLWTIAATALLVPAVAPARTFALSAASVRNDETALRDLRVRIVERAGSVKLQLDAAELSVPRLGLDGPLGWTCELHRDAEARTCAGPVHLAGRSAELELWLDDRRLEITLRKGAVRVAATVPFGAGESYTASLQQVPASWLRAPLAQSWRNGELRDGVFDAEAEVHDDGRAVVAYEVAGLAFSSGDGAVAGTGIVASGGVSAAPAGEDLDLEVDADLRGGSLQLGTLRVRLPDDSVLARLDARMDSRGRWNVAKFDWNDAGVLEAEAQGQIEPAALAPLAALDLRLRRVVLPLAMQRYARDLLDAQGLGRLRLNGEIAGEITLDRAGIRAVDLTTAALDADDGAGHVVRGLHGGIDWAQEGERPPRALGWKSVQAPGLRLPAARADWQARGGAMYLVGELRTKLFGGDVRLRQTVLHPLARDGERAATRFALRGLGYDSADGTLAAAKLSAEGEVRLSGPDASPRLQLDARLLGGEALAGAFYVQLPQTPVEVRADATWREGTLALQALEWKDPGTLVFGALGEIVPADAHLLRSLQVDLREARLDTAIGRYAQSWLASKGYAQLEGRGTLSGALHFDAEGLQRFAFDTRDVSLRDGAGRFALDGLDGGVGWEYRGATPATTLAWRSVELFRIPFGAARASFESRRGAIVLAEPLAVDVLGGQLRLEKLSLLPRSPRGERYAGSFAVVGLDMPRISAAFGWPTFPGSLSGGIPEIVMSGDTIEFRGGLDLYVFDGHLGVSGLTLERPFGIAPSLGANLHFENFDLEQFTSAFSLGGMSGRLFGTIEGLRLVDWSPVALDAWLRTNGGGRLSYKAVDDITSLGGGGGLSSNLQTMALKVFDTFGYRRFGLRCRLTREVCLMGGIDPLPAGETAPGSPADHYTIIEGSGVPRLDVVGHRRRVDWPTLVRRVHESMQGEGPIVK